VRVLFVPHNWASHYFPMVPLAWAFRSAGHEVRVAGQSSITDAIVRSGMPEVSVGGSQQAREKVAAVRQKLLTGTARKMRGGQPLDISAVPKEKRRNLVQAGFELHARVTEDIAADLVAFVRAWKPDLMIADPVVFAAPIAAAAAGVPLVRHLWGPDLLRQQSLFPGQGAAGDDGIREQWPAPLLALFDKFGVAVRSDFAVGTVDPCPASMQVQGLANRIPVRYVPYNGPGEMPRWLLGESARPRVCVSWSAGATYQAGPDSFPAAAVCSALAALDVEAIVAVKKADRERVAAAVPDARIVEELPLSLLLPTCRAAVNQGSAGTMLTAAACGVPQVVIPSIADQPLNATLIAGTGAGISIPGPQASEEAIAAAVADVVSGDAPRLAAARLRDEILAQPSPAEVAEKLTALASGIQR
jgi:UDP:flavonoid glycosyltransferase YjiC (YdhE family)